MVRALIERPINCLRKRVLVLEGMQLSHCEPGLLLWLLSFEKRNHFDQGTVTTGS
jgi:hypothetical protein